MPDLFADLTPPAVAPAGPVQDLDDLSAAPPAHFQGLAPQAPAPRVVAPLPGRSVDSTADIRTSIFERALQAAGELQPVSSRTHTLRVVNPRYEGPERFSVADQKKAILTGDTLGRKLRADLELLDTQGQVVHRRRTTLASIPYYTDRGTFINNGSEYSLANQMRLKPGVYTREKDNGEIEAHVNTTPGHGVPHRVYLERDTGVFKIKLGQASIPLVPLLQSLGVSTQQLRDAWGSDLATTNTFKTRGGDLEKIYERLVRGGEATEPAKMAAEIQQALADTKIDPEVSQHTLGKPYEHIDADVLLTTTRKLLAIHNRGNPEKLKQLGLDPAEQDDRDHLAFMRLLGPEDIIAERLRAGGKILRQALWRAGRKNSLAGMPPGILNRAVRGAILESGLGQVSEGVNPAQIFEQQMRVSRMGVGGIPSSDSVPASSRSVQPSHFGFIDPVSTPESSRAGVDSRLVRHLRKMPDGSLLGQFRDIRTGELVWKQPKEIFDSVIAFPGPMPPRPGVELDERGAQRLQQGLATGRIIKTESPETGEPRYWVPAMVRGKLRIVPAETVDVQLPHMEQAFSPLPNMVPLKSGMKGQRVAMAARMLTQSLPLENGESPLVQSGVPDEDDKSYEELYGERMGAIRAKQAGRVLAVTPDGIQVEYADGTQDTLETAQHLPNNVKTFFNQQATVQPGDTFEPGGLLARSNYVDKNGATALGLNARTGWMAFKGHNYEDAVVISESFAKRATSQHMYQHQVDVDPNEDQLGRSKFLSIFPGKFSKDQLGALDDDGIIRVGQKVEYGDPLVLMASHRHGRVGEISRAKAATWRDQSHTWDHETPGVVTDIARTRDGGVLVAVKTQAPSMVGDKFSGRHGNKGVAASVVPDDEMPIGADGKPLEVLYNPLGVISRSNPSQVAEALLGKIAAATGKSYKVKDFEDIGDLMEFVQQELTKHGMTDTETVTDPETGKQIPGVLVGNTFVMKLHHMAAAKTSGRAFGAYTADNAPAKGGPEGSKTMGMLHLNALLSHGATGAIRDASLIRGQKNPEYWAAVMSGRTPPDPPVPFIYKKFINQLQAAGINPVRTGTRTHIMAMTNADINRLAEDRELQAPDTVDWRSNELQPIQGGLFDEKLFGGAKGGRWAKIKLAEPMLNPVMEEPARRLLGLTKDQLHSVIAGRMPLHGKTGPEALKSALAGLDVPREIEKARREINSGTVVKRDAATRRLGYLLGSQKTGVSPGDWVWDAVPVLPPQFRPISKMRGTGTPMVADANYLYRDLFELNKNLHQNKQAFDDIGDERLAVYDAIKAVTGLGDPVAARSQEQGIKGILKHVLGHSPKYSVMQRRLLGSTTDLVGRSTIIPNPDLDMDSVGIPETQAWKIYQPFIVRHMAKRGMPPERAAELVLQKHKTAREALLQVMQERPVMIDRAPVLHRYGVMAFWPRLTKSENLETSPIVIKGFGGDYDGDAMHYHVPADEGAVRDAIEKMLPSRNLLAVSDFKAHYTPSQEYLGGLYSGSTAQSNLPPIRFRTRREALSALRAHMVEPGRMVEIERADED